MVLIIGGIGESTSRRVRFAQADFEPVEAAGIRGADERLCETVLSVGTVGAGVDVIAAGGGKPEQARL